MVLYVIFLTQVPELKPQQKREGQYSLNVWFELELL